jgi:hypothetical protein
MIRDPTSIYESFILRNQSRNKATQREQWQVLHRWVRHSFACRDGQVDTLYWMFQKSFGIYNGVVEIVIVPDDVVHRHALPHIEEKCRHRHLAWVSLRIKTRSDFQIDATSMLFSHTSPHTFPALLQFHDPSRSSKVQPG